MQKDRSFCNSKSNTNSVASLHMPSETKGGYYFNTNNEAEVHYSNANLRKILADN